MTESAYDQYLRLRKDWLDHVHDRANPLRSEWKDRLFDRLSRLWNRMTQAERSCAAAHVRMAGWL